MLAHYRLLVFITVVATLFVLLDELFDSDTTSTGQKYAFSLFAVLAGLWKTHGAEGNDVSHNPMTYNLQEHFVELPIDHNNLHGNTFQNRFWVNSDYYLPGGPVFVHDVGESDAESAARRHLGNADSYLKRYLQEFNGVGIVWEHRYYGKSLPFPVTQATSAEQLRYLSLDQALADLPYFARNFSLPSLDDVDLTPASTPWVMIGCSYSGLRAAFSRQRYPETFHAAYAASAPVQLQVGLHTFFDSVHYKLIDNGRANCAHDLHAIMQYLDVKLSTAHDAFRIKQRLLGVGAETNSNGDFAMAVTNIYSYFQSAGITGGKYSLGSLCEYLERGTVPRGNGVKPSMTTRYGAQAAFERFITWPGLIAIINDHFGVKCGASGNQSEPDCDLGRPDVDAESISWTWQMCSELGLFAIRNFGPTSLVSRYLSLDFRLGLCEKQFPKSYIDGEPTAPAHVDLINRKSGGSKMRPSNTFWSAGQYDPWRSMTTLASEEYDTKPSHVVAFTDEIPACNVSTGTDTIFGHVIPNAQHCLDWSIKSEEAAVPRQHFARALREWLPCFVQRSPS